MGTPFQITADFSPCGDQPQAIVELQQGLQAGLRDQVLLGVTGSGKTYTMAQVIARMERPALILAHNKTLAGQLYGEMKSFFPNNAVEYFVSYYDYYQPEAYVPRTDTFIEKDSSINEQIDRMRHAATRALLTRRDVVIVASVSCIYGLGSPDSYQDMSLTVKQGTELDQRALLRHLVEIQFKRNDIDFQRGTFRVRGDRLEIFPAHEENLAIRVEQFGDTIERILQIDPLTGRVLGELDEFSFFPASHYVTQRSNMLRAMEAIREELRERLEFFRQENRLVEAQRLESRTMHDLEMIQELGYCTGIENYSRHLTGRRVGEPPPTLFEYLPQDAVLFVDESHVTLSQLRGMFRGDRSRKETLVDYGFRLPSALDNRPLTFEEWDVMRPLTIHVSATPGPVELARVNGRVVEQIIRPTGLIDPKCEVRPATQQVDDLIKEIRLTLEQGFRVLVTTLTKRMAEDLTEYLGELNIPVRYLHSDVETLDRLDIIRDLRLGVFQVLIGINLLREGLDLPEVALVAILDADKEGFLRSETSLIQTIGRAARNVEGRVILYADKVTGSMARAMQETERRRAIQKAYNQEHGITPTSIRKEITDVVAVACERDYYIPDAGKGSRQPEKETVVLQSLPKEIKRLEKMMKEAAKRMAFEEAALYRDRILELQKDALLQA